MDSFTTWPRREGQPAPEHVVVVQRDATGVPHAQISSSKIRSLASESAGYVRADHLLLTLMALKETSRADEEYTSTIEDAEDELCIAIEQAQQTAHRLEGTTEPTERHRMELILALTIHDNARLAIAEVESLVQVISWNGQEDSTEIVLELEGENGSRYTKSFPVSALADILPVDDYDEDAWSEGGSRVSVAGKAPRMM